MSYKGYKMSEEQKKKISLALYGRKVWNTGLKGYKTQPHTELTKEKIRNSNLKTYTKIKWKWQKENHPNWGKHINVGENHPLWIKDRTQLAKRQERNDMAYKDWRRNVWLRDNFKCRMDNLDCDGRLETHHILNWKDYPELRYEVKNGITLCKFHHPRKRIDEKNLASIFQKLVEG